MHRKDFERRVDRFVHSHAYTELREDDGEAGKRRWIVQIHKRPPLIRWGALIGDCLFNFRSALDHLAYDLAVANNQGRPLPTTVEETSEFPLFSKRPPTKRELDRRIGAIDQKARKLIEGMQPYGRKDRAALKYLNDLQNFDKHRTLHLVFAVSKGLSYWGDIGEFDFLNFGPLEHGDVLAEIALTSDPKRQQNPNFTYGVAFSKDGPGAKAPDVVRTLDWIGLHIEDGVIKPLLPFL